MSFYEHGFGGEKNVKKGETILWPCVSFFVLFLMTKPFFAYPLTFLNTYFLLLAFGYYWFRDIKFPHTLTVFTLCFLLMIAIGMIGGLGYKQEDWLKDGWYFANPLLILSTGYVFGRNSNAPMCAVTALLCASIILSCFHIYSFIENPSLLFEKANEVRKEAGGGNIGTALSVAFLLAGYQGNRLLHAVALILCGSSFILSFSRTSLLAFLLLYFALKGLMGGKRLVTLGLIVALLAGGLLLVGHVMPEDRSSFLGKLARSNKELTIQDFTSMQDISDNYRGYETARTLNDYFAGTPHEMVFGRGFGHLTDLGVYILDMRYIPIMHNGIAYVLLKTGIVGLLLFLGCFGYFFIKMFPYINADDPELRFAARTVQGLIAACLVCAWIVSGPFNKTLFNSSMYLLGFFLAVFNQSAVVSPEERR